LGFSFINHSSNHFNARITTTYTNAKHAIEATEKISNGQEILIQYLTFDDEDDNDEEKGRQQNKLKLKLKYGFEEKD
jgi:hypothetical protein